MAQLVSETNNTSLTARISECCDFLLRKGLQQMNDILVLFTSPQFYSSAAVVWSTYEFFKYFWVTEAAENT